MRILEFFCSLFFIFCFWLVIVCIIVVGVIVDCVIVKLVLFFILCWKVVVFVWLWFDVFIVCIYWFFVSLLGDKVFMREFRWWFFGSFWWGGFKIFILVVEWLYVFLLGWIELFWVGVVLLSLVVGGVNEGVKFLYVDDVYLVVVGEVLDWFGLWSGSVDFWELDLRFGCDLRSFLWRVMFLNLNFVLWGFVGIFL